MATTITKTAAQLKAERDDLNRAIRNAERAEKRAAEQAVVDAKLALGEYLAEALGATTVEAIEGVQLALDVDQIKEQVEAALAAAEADEPSTEDDDSETVEDEEQSTEDDEAEPAEDENGSPEEPETGDDEDENPTTDEEDSHGEEVENLTSEGHGDSSRTW